MFRGGTTAYPQIESTMQANTLDNAQSNHKGDKMTAAVR